MDTENSLNSSPDSTASGSKSVFKKPTNFYEAFDVSMEESLNATQNDQTDIDLDKTSVTRETLPFKKSRKSVQHSFNVSHGESVINNDSEQSITFTKPQALFSKQNKSLEDYFNVSFNETNSQATIQDKSIDIDESVTIHDKSNPFKKKNSSQTEVTIGMELSAQASEKEEIENEELDHSEEVQKTSNSCQENVDEEETDSTVFVTKSNPFKKSVRPENESVTNISVTESSRINEEDMNENVSADNTEVNDSEDLSVFKTKENPFHKKKSIENNDSDISITKVRSIRSPETNDLLNEPTQNSKNISLTKSMSVLTSNISYHEQSSINDDNLNNWMSDESDEEIPPPTVPSVTSRLSSTKEKQAPLNTSPTETNPLSMWEQKVNDMISNAEKKSNALRFKTKLDSPKNMNAFKKPKISNKNTVKKSKTNENKTAESIEDNENQYKPPKLIKPASFASKQMYAHVIKKLKPKYGIDAKLESEDLVLLICDTVKKVLQRKTHQKKLIQNLKKEMAKAGLIETTVDFYEFIIKFLPYSFRVKVIPCLQPVTNMIYPPKDVLNPLDKIL